MLKFSLSLVSLLTSLTVFATDGKTTKCFDMAIQVPNFIGSVDDGPYDDNLLIKTKGKLCIEERNLKWEADEQTAVGDFSVTIQNQVHGHVIYKFGASFSEGAMGSSYTTYAPKKSDLDPVGRNNQKSLLFIMRNDHFQKGDVIGRVHIGENLILLLQQ